MSLIKRTCSITGKQFEVSDQEQALREKFQVPLPIVHPFERMRYLMAFENVENLYPDTCDLCGKRVLSIWGSNPVFPVYCTECWHSDKWSAPEADGDLKKSFFDQVQDLINKSPHAARYIIPPMENSDYSGYCTALKNCYMAFDAGNCEDCYYFRSGERNKNVIDTVCTDYGEYMYHVIACHKSYRVFWSEFSSNCTECYFLYDCVACSNCAFSSGLRHKEYIFQNEQLTKEAYEKKISELNTGSYTKLQEYLQLFSDIKKQYAKKYIIGNTNENVQGNVMFQCKDVEEGYFVTKCENCINVAAFWNSKDCLDVAAYGNTAENCYSCTSIGTDTTNTKYSWASCNKSFNLEYCAGLQSSNNCFGSVFAKKKEFAILNKVYQKDEYEQLKAKIIEKMKTDGEYNSMFRHNMVPFPYNDSLANFFMPLTKEQALKMGFRWAHERVIPTPKNLILEMKDDIKDTEWKDVEGKVVICEETRKPFKLMKTEFDFYKKYDIPLPRIHPLVRIKKLYPWDILFNDHEAVCDSCGKKLITSMKEDDKVLCEECYQKAVV